jgi:hypothetical protein
VSSVGLKEDGLRLDRVQKSLAGGSDCESQVNFTGGRQREVLNIRVESISSSCSAWVDGSG